MTRTDTCPFEKIAREFETVADNTRAATAPADPRIATRLRVLAETVRADCSCREHAGTASKDCCAGEAPSGAVPRR